MRRTTTTCAMAAAAALAVTASDATARECAPALGLSPCFDADNLWAQAGPSTWLSIGGGTTTPAGQAGFGLVLSYLSQPVIVLVGSADPEGSELVVLDNMFDATFLMDLGVTDELALTVAAPVTLYQDGAGLGPVYGTGEELPRSIIRDPRFGYALALVPRSRTPSDRLLGGSPDGFAVTHRFQFTAPVGAAQSFGGARTMTAVPSVAVELVYDRLRLGAELGLRIRGETEFANAVWGSQLSGAAGAAYEVLPSELLIVGLEAFALQTLSAQDPRPGEAEAGALVPAEWILSATTQPFLGGDVAFTVGGGGSIPFQEEPALTSPRFRFDAGIRYAPRGRDRDDDGVLDKSDACPLEPEDRDGFEDADGCPDPDNDGDGIPDERDRCRDEAETVDGHQDEDGCPDDDDDDDGVPDGSDRCRNDPEDPDGFEDDDGCPDPDNDGDGIPDERDRCPNGAEDMDGFKDEDGCPDPDNDQDGVPDVRDRCPDAREDTDGFEDDDGCPEPDNDQDGVLDGADRCPGEAETLDGVEDEDGCPEPGATSVVRWAGDRVEVRDAGRFVAGRADPDARLAQQIEMMAALVRGRAPLASVIIEAYPDRAGDASGPATDLAARRAEVVRARFLAAGIPADVITAAAGDPAAQKRATVDVTAQRVAPPAPSPKAPE